MNHVESAKVTKLSRLLGLGITDINTRNKLMNSIQTSEPTDTTNYGFGVCPKCQKSDGYMNIGREHWGLCDEHKICWHIGSNLFSGWKDETEGDWESNSEKLASFTQVTPDYGPQPKQHVDAVSSEFEQTDPNHKD